MAKKLLSIIEQHDYMSLVTPNGRFTMSYGGEKASGFLAMPSETKFFDAMIKFVRAESVKPGMNFGKAFKKLEDEKKLTTLWPNWNKKSTNPFKGDGTEIIQFNNDMAKYRAKYGNGRILSNNKNGKDLLIKFEKEDQPIRMAYMYFELIPKK